MSVLQDLPVAAEPHGRRALAYGIEWALGMQSRNGGWAAFDPDHDSRAFHAQFPGVALGGFFCSGEIGPVGGATRLHGFTSSFGLFMPRQR